MNDALMEMLKPVMAAIGTALAAIVAAAIVKALSKLAEKLGIQVDNEERVRQEAIVRQAVMAVSERAAKMTLEHLNMPAEQKLQRAVDIVRKELPELEHDKIVTLIHAALARHGLAADAKVRAGEGPKQPMFPEDPTNPTTKLKVVD